MRRRCRASVSVICGFRDRLALSLNAMLSLATLSLPVRRGLFLSLTSLLLLGCAGYEEEPTRFEMEERSARETFASAPIALSGCLLSSKGTPVTDATVEIQSQRAGTDDTGCFSLDELERNNALLRIQAPGSHTELVPVHLTRSTSEKQLILPPIWLASHDHARFKFGGDVQMGRRMLDPDQSTPLDELPPDDEEATIRVSEPLDDSKALFQHVRPLLESSDQALVNLETVFTTQPDTPHQDKTFVFFSLPGSAPALSWAGIDYVSLANNHAYDYLHDGLVDTLAALEPTGLKNSGTGLNVTEAFEPAVLSARGQNFALVSLTAVEGSTGLGDSSATNDRSGTASLNDAARIAETLSAAEARNEIPLVMAHTGYEYTRAPPPDGHTLPTLESLVAAGARLVVGHHPHVPQGFSFYEDTLIAHSLGNFVFDQERLETLVGTLLQIDFDEQDLARATAHPLQIQDFAPRPLAGAGAERAIKRLADSSASFGALVVPTPAGGIIAQSGNTFSTHRRSVQFDVSIPEEGQALVDLRPHLESYESAASLDAPSLSLRKIGKNLILSGDIEDYAVDGTPAEAADWFVSGLDSGVTSGFVCQSHVYRGAFSLCSIRTERNTGESTISFRRRIRVPGDKVNRPNKDISILSYVYGKNAGPTTIEVEYQASLGSKVFGHEVVARLDPGDYGWTATWSHLSMPEDEPIPLRTQYSQERRKSSARAFRLRALHRPPLSGEALFAIDDVAVIAWEPDTSPQASWATPNSWEFALVEGAPGSHQVTLNVVHRTLAAASQ